MASKKSRSKAVVVSAELAERRIHLVRDQKVMTDADLAGLYGVPTKRLNEQVRRNLKRFPKDFMFKLNAREASSLRSQIATSNTATRGGRRYVPYVFTEHGVAMLSSVLNSDRAVEVSIMIVRAFIRIREYMATHSEVVREIADLKRQQQKQGELIVGVIDAINRLLHEPVKPKRAIGFSAPGRA